MKSFLYHITLLICLFSFNSVNAQDKTIYVIVHSSIIQDVDNFKLSSIDVQQIYTLKEQRWKSGSRIYIADYKGTPKVRTKFYDFMKMQINSMKKIWLRAQFTGRSIPPSIVNSEAEMMLKVQTKPGTIGYVTTKNIPDNIVIIKEINN